MACIKYDIQVRIVLLRIDGLGYRKIVKAILSEENVKVSKKSVEYY